MVKLPGYALAAALLALVLAACGSSSSSSSTASSASSSATSTSSASSAPAPAATGAKSGALTIAANPSGQLKYTKSTLSAKAGKVTISFTNSSPVAHNLTIQQGTNGKILGATPTFQGGSKTVTVNLKPGMYTFFCSVPGHRMAGMHGVLTVS
ncbi:MAG: cupredoxin domain-containing protein [Solirubrobacterales bacterium]|nr:cupredoxin domain-containing protein [Solirubrobacterales bacterium]